MPQEAPISVMPWPVVRVSREAASSVSALHEQVVETQVHGLGHTVLLLVSRQVEMGVLLDRAGGRPGREFPATPIPACSHRPDQEPR